MGPSVSRGRKYSPTKNVSNSPSNLEHAKFTCSDSLPQSTLSNCFETKPEPSSMTGLDYVEGVVCKEGELAEDEMKVCTLGKENHKVLLVKKNGEIFALGHKCTHYGAPLVSGFLGKDRIRCQWHGACFNLKTGDIEDFPGLDSLPCFEVKILNGEVIVRADIQQLRMSKRIKPFTSIVEPEKSTFLVVGGGAAGTTCVENLRALGYDGRIIFVMGEKYLPYDRVKLSKTFDLELDKILLRPKSFYMERNIELKQDTTLEQLIPEEHLAVLSTSEAIKYDKIFLATGASPAQMVVPGADLRNIFYLRTLDDITRIKASLTSSTRLVILGSSFIGMEAASYCDGKVKSVTVIGQSIPFKSVFGEVIGNRLTHMYHAKNVLFYLNTSVQEFQGQDGKVVRVILKDGTKLDADVCILGIGNSANTAYLSNTKIRFQPNCTIEVNEYLETQLPNVYAGGDVAYAPVLGMKASIGHWGLACYHGHVAAYNMLGHMKPLKAVPFFWTMLFGRAFRYAGYAKQFDDVVIDGNLDDLHFIAFHCSGNNVLAVTTSNRDPLASKFAEMLYENKKLYKNKIQEFLR